MHWGAEKIYYYCNSFLQGLNLLQVFAALDKRCLKSKVHILFVHCCRIPIHKCLNEYKRQRQGKS